MRPAITLLSAALLACPLPIFFQESKSAREKPPQKDYSFSVPAELVWMDTGIDLSAGDRVHISGGILDCAGPYPSEKAHLPLPSAPGGALIAKVHAEAAPVLATPDAELPVIDPSHLYLGVNAWQCHGKLPAKVHIEPHQAAPQKH
jgi:hypothetical protein